MEELADMCAWFGRKKPKEPVQPKEKPKTIVCPFCKGEFTDGEFLFALEDKVNGERDEIYENFIRENYQTGQLDANKRRLFALKKDNNKVISCEADSGLPMIVQADFYRLPPRSSEEMLEEQSNEPVQKSKNSTHRLCPNCHCELPSGTGNYKEIRIGMYGGPRSGKTTYMCIAAYALRDLLPRLGLGTVVVASESRPVLEHLNKQATSRGGANATATDKPPFPIIMTVTPMDKKYLPFNLIFQDIPGEAATPNNVTLVNHPFTSSDAFIGVVDINMFMMTQEKAELISCQTKLAEQQSEEDKRSIEERLEQIKHKVCSARFQEIYGNVSNFGVLMKKLHSVQLVLTKMDRWIDLLDSDDGNSLLADGNVANLKNCGEVISDKTEEHKGAIDESHLDLLNRQLHSLLPSDVKAKDGNTMLEWLVGDMKSYLDIQHWALAAVASRRENGAHFEGNMQAYQDSINILDPIFNVLRWEKMLPVKESQQ